MRFSRFGVTLERLAPERLELVRTWRNSSWVRPHMRVRARVEPSGQASWFERLDPRDDWYFVAQASASPFALFHVKAIDWSRSCGEAGGFVGDPRLIGRPEPAQATLALMDFAFLILRLSALEAQYRVDLEDIMRFNSQLGYRVIRHEDDGFLRARVEAERYFAHAAVFREAAVDLHGVTAELAASDGWLAERVESPGAPTRADFRLRLR